MKDKIQKKNLSKFKVWPSVLGILLSGGLFLFIMIMMMSYYIECVFGFNMDEYEPTIHGCITLVLSEDNDSLESRKKEYEMAAKYMPYITDMVILDSDYECKEHYTEGDLPDFTKAKLVSPKNSSYEVYSFSPIFSIVNDEIQIESYEAFKLGMHAIDEKKDVSIDYWYIYKIDNQIVAVEYTKIMTTENFSYFTVILVSFLFLFLCVLFYHLWNLIATVKKNKILSFLLYTDEMTNGFNWLYFTKKSEQYIKRSQKKRKKAYSYAMVTIRMEKYTSFISTHGAEKAEELLAKFDKIICSNLSNKELSCHYDRSDFALLLELTTKEELEERIQGLMQKLDSVMLEEKFYFSCGISKIVENDPKLLYVNASIARYTVKEGQENRIVWFDDSLQQDILWERTVENDMDKALENGEFVVYLQPKYRPKDGKLGGAEALIRWIHPEKGFIGPGDFIPIFERNGFIISIDDFMLRTVAHYQALWIRSGFKVVPISVNVSRLHFAKSNLAEHIATIVDLEGCPRDVIEIELTESAFFDDKDALIDTVKKLQEMGFRVSMDDFGAGYSSLNSLKELPLDVIKIDAEFFRNVSDLERANTIVKETITLARKLGMKTVAEGVEESEQVDFLAHHGCDLIQGYYYSKPIPVDEFVKKSYMDSIKKTPRKKKNASIEEIEQ